MQQRVPSMESSEEVAEEKEVRLEEGVHEEEIHAVASSYRHSSPRPVLHPVLWLTTRKS